MLAAGLLLVLLMLQVWVLLMQILLLLSMLLMVASPHIAARSMHGLLCLMMVAHVGGCNLPCHPSSAAWHIFLGSCVS